MTSTVLQRYSMAPFRWSHQSAPTAKALSVLTIVQSEDSPHAILVPPHSASLCIVSFQKMKVKFICQVGEVIVPSCLPNISLDVAVKVSCRCNL